MRTFYAVFLLLLIFAAPVLAAGSDLFPPPPLDPIRIFKNIRAVIFVLGSFSLLIGIPCFYLGAWSRHKNRVRATLSIYAASVLNIILLVAMAGFVVDAWTGCDYYDCSQLSLIFMTVTFLLFQILWLIGFIQAIRKRILWRWFWTLNIVIILLTVVIRLGAFP